jgi:hypothetical protein
LQLLLLLEQLLLRVLPPEFFIDGSCEAVLRLAPGVLADLGKLLFSRFLSRTRLQIKNKFKLKKTREITDFVMSELILVFGKILVKQYMSTIPNTHNLTAAQVILNRNHDRGK